MLLLVYVLYIAFLCYLIQILLPILKNIDIFMGK